MPPPLAAETNQVDYQNNAYNEVKQGIDTVRRNSNNAKAFEIGKGEVLAACQPYVAYLAKGANASEADVIRTLLELSNETAFFDSMAEQLELISQRAGEGLETGDIRVHAYTVYTITRLRKPTVMVETGVANGKSSALILHAMRKNGLGKLYSIDLPEIEGDPTAVRKDAMVLQGKQSGWMVPNDLRANWDLRLGDSRELLPQLKAELADGIDIFMHDSLHTYDHMTFEMELAKPWVKPNGLLMVDDIQDNTAYSEQTAGWQHAAFGTFGFLWR